MNTLSQPFAEILRPKTIDDVIGQDHLLGDDCPIRNAVISNKLPSIILWGPPGVGKTSIAYAIANSVNYEFISLSAVLSGVKDIREAVDKANFNKDQNQKKTMLFIKFYPPIPTMMVCGFTKMLGFTSAILTRPQPQHIKSKKKETEFISL